MNKNSPEPVKKGQHTHNLITICARCKRMRTEDGQWQAVDPAALEALRANISHGFCPTCFEELYADVR